MFPLISFVFATHTNKFHPFLHHVNTFVINLSPRVSPAVPIPFMCFLPLPPPSPSSFLLAMIPSSLYLSSCLPFERHLAGRRV